MQLLPTVVGCLLASPVLALPPKPREHHEQTNSPAPFESPKNRGLHDSQGYPESYGPPSPSAPSHGTWGNHGHGSCEQPVIRREWRSLNTPEKKDYIDAVLCLQRHDAITKEQFADNDELSPINRFDDFHAVHNSQTPDIHFVGAFAIWHRYLVAEYERTLREICGYSGAQPYWDWSRDASLTNNHSNAIFETDVFSPTVGFGGDGCFVELAPEDDVFDFNTMGHTGGGCVQDGPFREPNFRINVAKPGCLKRDFSAFVMNWFGNSDNVDVVLNQPDYASFAFELEGFPNFTRPNCHGSGHFGLGGGQGTIGDNFNSPGDPLFYLHHAQVDRIFWQWQQKDLPARLHEVGGPIKRLDFGGPSVTLDFEINMGAIAGNVTLHDLLDTEGGTLCYTYDE